MSQPSYQIAAACPYCDAEAGEPCRTQSGYDATDVHADRIRASREMRRSGQSGTTRFPADKIKLALWYIDQCGSEENALSYLERAMGALGSKSDQVRTLLDRNGVCVSLIDPTDSPPGITFSYEDQDGNKWYGSLGLTRRICAELKERSCEITMTIYQASFSGSKVGSIGAPYGISVKVEASNPEEARAKLYEDYQHISRLELVAVDEGDSA